MKKITELLKEFFKSLESPGPKKKGLGMGIFSNPKTANKQSHRLPGYCKAPGNPSLGESLKKGYRPLK